MSEQNQAKAGPGGAAGRDRQPAEVVDNGEGGANPQNAGKVSPEEIRRRSERAAETQKPGGNQHDRSDPVHPGPHLEAREKKAAEHPAPREDEGGSTRQ